MTHSFGSGIRFSGGALGLLAALLFLPATKKEQQSNGAIQLKSFMYQKKKKTATHE